MDDSQAMLIEQARERLASERHDAFVLTADGWRRSWRAFAPLFVCPAAPGRA
jgi:hypothetical protein